MGYHRRNLVVSPSTLQAKNYSNSEGVADTVTTLIQAFSYSFVEALVLATVERFANVRSLNATRLGAARAAGVPEQSPANLRCFRASPLATARTAGTGCFSRLHAAPFNYVYYYFFCPKSSNLPARRLTVTAWNANVSESNFEHTFPANRTCNAGGCELLVRLVRNQHATDRSSPETSTEHQLFNVAIASIQRTRRLRRPHRSVRSFQCRE